MDRQKGRLQKNLASSQKDFDSIVNSLTKKLKETGKLVHTAVAENDSKKFKKHHETAKKHQQELEATLDKILGYDSLGFRVIDV